MDSKLGEAHDGIDVDPATMGATDFPHDGVESDAIAVREHLAAHTDSGTSLAPNNASAPGPVGCREGENCCQLALGVA